MLWAEAVGRDAVAGGWGLRGAGRGVAVRAGNQIRADGAASLAPSLGRMTQLTSLNLMGTMCDIGGSWGCLRVLVSTGNALMMLCAVVRGGYALGRSGWWGLRGASRGAAVRAGNWIGDDAAASLRSSVPATCAVYL